MWKLNFDQRYQQMQKILRYAYGIVLLTINRSIFYLFWSCELRANIDCTIKLKWHFNYTHLCMTSYFGEVMFSRTNALGALLERRINTQIYDKLCSHSSWENTENLLLGLRLFIQSFTHVLLGKSSLSARWWHVSANSIRYRTFTNSGGMIWGVRIAIFTEIRHLVEELITFLSIFGPQNLYNFTARLNKSLSILTWMHWEGINE